MGYNEKNVNGHEKKVGGKAMIVIDWQVIANK